MLTRNDEPRPRFGEIWMCHLTNNDGSIQSGYRPVFILSNDKNNTYSTTLNIIPITSKMNKRSLPVHVELLSYQKFGLKTPSTMMIEQTTTITVKHLDRKIGMISDRQILMDIGRAMSVQFPMTWEMVEDIIRRLHTDSNNHIRADYLELIILLYYNGFENATEIVEMQESDINHRAKTVLLPGRTIHLSDRCYTLLTKFNAMTEGWRNYVLVSWHGSYFKFIVRASNEYDIDDRPLKAMRENINVYLCKYVNNEYNTHINYSNLYLLGFYDFLKNKFGEDKVDEMLLSNYDSDSVQQLQQSAREYGFKFENVSHLKRRLRMFVKTDEE